jgi:hypothetical protein
MWFINVAHLTTNNTGGLCYSFYIYSALYQALALGKCACGARVSNMKKERSQENFHINQKVLTSTLHTDVWLRMLDLVGQLWTQIPEGKTTALKQAAERQG